MCNDEWLTVGHRGENSTYSQFGAVGSQNLGFFLTLRDSDLHILSNRVTSKIYTCALGQM